MGTRRSAFTLAEILLAAGLITMVLLGLVGLTLGTVRSSQKSADLAAAHQIAKRELDRVIEQSMADSTFWDQEHLSTPWATDTVTVGTTEYEYEVFAQTLQNPSQGGALGTSSSPDNRLKKVDIELRWWGDAERDGYGKLSVRATRLVNEENP